MSADSPEVLVVGSGPTGLMAACLLARCGVRVRVLDKSATQAHESRAFGWQARSLELVQKMGLVDRFLERGVTATGVRFHVNGAQVAELNFDDLGREDTPYAFLFLLAQNVTEELLAQDLREHGVQVEHGWEVTDVQQDAARVTVEARGPDGGSSVLQADYVVGADGAHSVVRKRLGLTFEGAPYPQSFLLADCRVRWPLAADRLNLFVRERSLAIYMPLRDRDLARVIAIRPPAGERPDEPAGPQTDAPPDLAEVEAAFREATGVDVTLDEPRWLSRYRIHHRGVNRYRVSRVLVAGDAAHIHSPAGGQGMNTGLQDAANLAWKLALALRGAREVEALLESYHEERWPVGQRVLNFTDRLFGFVSSQTGWVAKVRNFLIPLFTGTLARNGRLRSKAFHFLSQLGIRYEGGDFLHDDCSPEASDSWLQGLTPGHRAPNGQFARHQDVFDLLAGYAFDVLAFSREALGEVEMASLAAELAKLPAPVGLPLRTHLIANALTGRDSRFHRAECSQAFDLYGITQASPRGLFLIRPDGYIAFRSDRLELASLTAFLQKFR